MALSDWDTLAFDSNGEPCAGELESFDGKHVCSIYKNWLQIVCPENHDYGMIGTTVVFSGKVEMGTLAIFAEEKKVNGNTAIFVYVEDSHSEKEQRMAGIGCPGYKNQYDRVMQEHGLSSEEWLFTCSYALYELAVARSIYFDFEHKQTKESKTIEIAENASDYEPVWAGISKELLDEFIEWLRELDVGTDGFTPWVEKVAAAEAMRFNQGDMFFAQHLNEPALLQASSPGNALEPILTRLCKNTEPGEKK